jgi:hypothetical protein
MKLNLVQGLACCGHKIKFQLGKVRTLWNHKYCKEECHLLGCNTVWLIRTDISVKCITSIIRVKLAANVVPSSQILFILMMEAVCSPKTSVLTRAT